MRSENAELKKALKYVYSLETFPTNSLSKCFKNSIKDFIWVSYGFHMAREAPETLQQQLDEARAERDKYREAQQAG